MTDHRAICHRKLVDVELQGLTNPLITSSRWSFRTSSGAEVLRNKAVALASVRREIVLRVLSNPLSVMGKVQSKIVSVLVDCLEKPEPSRLERTKAFVDGSSLPIVVTNSADGTVVHCNDAWCGMCGYARDEALGRNCRFLQGPGTELAAVCTVVDTIRRGDECTLRLTNYRRSGETFQNLISLRPVKDPTGVVRFYIGVQLDCAEIDANLRSVEDPSPYPSGPNTSFHDPTPMPARFTEEAVPALNKQRQEEKKRKQLNPTYHTTTSEIGSLDISASDLPMRWYGLRGEFTNAFFLGGNRTYFRRAEPRVPLPRSVKRKGPEGPFHCLLFVSRS